MKRIFASRLWTRIIRRPWGKKIHLPARKYPHIARDFPLHVQEAPSFSYRRQANFLMMALGAAWPALIFFAVAFAPNSVSPSAFFWLCLLNLIFAGMLTFGLRFREINKRKRELSEQSAILQSIVDSMPDGVVVADTNGKFILFNPAAEQIIGSGAWDSNPAEWAEEYGLYLPDKITPFPAAQNPLVQAMQGQAAPTVEMFMRHPKRPHGLWLHVTGMPLKEATGRSLGGVVVLRDVTAQMQAEQALRQSEKLAATGRMSARIAHEINNPLAGIKNSFLLVKDGIPTNHRYYDYVRRIESEIERIARIVRQMFDLYRPQHDSVRSFPADIAIHDVVALLRTNCREHDITIDVEINAASLNVAISESSLRQVLYNIIQNAVDASPIGGAVKVCAAIQQDKLTINIIDYGHGIPEEIRYQIFEPFFTTKSGFERSGLGLGLSVSKGLIEAMGGALNFESTVGKGTNFQIVLPLENAAVKTGTAAIVALP